MKGETAAALVFAGHHAGYLWLSFPPGDRAARRLNRTWSDQRHIVGDPDIVDYALRIPPELKLRRDDEVTEKWILRQALTGALPDEVLWRRKAKFWQVVGVGELLAQYAEARITDEDFERERTLPNGWTLNTKEEVMYYQVFKEHFGELNDLSWMGRTKSAPKH